MFAPPPPTAESPAAMRLRGLAIAYVVLAGFLAMLAVTFALFGVATILLGIEGGPPLAMCVVEAVTMGTFAALLGHGAYGLHTRTRLGAVKRAAVVACIVFPIGTVLGVLAFRWIAEDPAAFAS